MTITYTETDAARFQMEADHAEAESKKYLIEILQDQRRLLCEVDDLAEEFEEAGLDAFQSQLDRLGMLTSSIDIIRDDLLRWLKEGLLK